MANIQKLENELNQMIMQGKIKEAMERFYDKNVIMQENLEKPRKGYQACLRTEMEFMENVNKFNKMQLVGDAVNGDVSYSEWDMDIEMKDGHKMKGPQIAARHWKNGKIVHERFYYDSKAH